MAKEKQQRFSFDDWKQKEAGKVEQQEPSTPQTDQRMATSSHPQNGNLGYLFNHRYYAETDKINFNNLSSEANEKYFKNKNKEICGYLMEPIEFEKLGNVTFPLTTQYPGLALGLGYGHGIKALGEFKLGFSFDYTSGLPIIPASTVKGMLRNAFPCKGIHKKPIFTEEKTAYIRDLLKDTSIDVDVLEKEIFEGRDVFFDAVIDKKHNGKRIVGDDSITPHGSNPLRNPTPLLFLKILPNITIHFDFELHKGLINVEHKKQLFQQIIIDLGIGAKTNVGYGRLQPPKQQTP